MNSGVYIIENKKNGHRYVGSSINLKSRKRQHFRDLRNKNHDNDHLQKAYSKYGEESFKFTIQEYCKRKHLISREQWWLDNLSHHYNICQVAGSTFGVNHTDKAKAKMSKSQMGNTNGKGGKGKKLSDETRAKMSKTKTGRKRKPFTAEHKAKISVANTGRKHTAETRANMSVAKIGNANGQGNRGRKFTPEHRAKLSKANLAYNARKREENNSNAIDACETEAMI